MAKDDLYIFQQLSSYGKAQGHDQPNSADAINWFRQMASSIGSVNKNQMMKSRDDGTSLVNNVKVNDIGQMFLWSYDPKTKDKLPYYDTFPLGFITDMTENGFTALNTHYLPPVLKANLMDALYSTAQNKKYDAKQKLNISYKILKNASKFKYFEPCFKRYLNNHIVSSKLLFIPSQYWDISLFLPLARFQKASQQTVWDDSRAMVGGEK